MYSIGLKIFDDDYVSFRLSFLNDLHVSLGKVGFSTDENRFLFVPESLIRKLYLDAVDSKINYGVENDFEVGYVLDEDSTIFGYCGKIKGVGYDVYPIDIRIDDVYYALKVVDANDLLFKNELMSIDIKK